MVDELRRAELCCRWYSLVEPIAEYARAIVYIADALICARKFCALCEYAWNVCYEPMCAESSEQAWYFSI